ncbi:ankyrin repeat domain-containing protein [Nocardiopsis potens]|uniref:ankyrin repeat domain-containing protein n=1 Tax=Nocardiopsis potens TaxID=1246458 RepID=UPI0003495B74|nr:ankyrin repeat domain-containing protein [Nocardiopsis potens]
MSDTEPPAQDPVDDPDVIDLATRIFDSARRGDTDSLGAYLAAGVPPDLTNDKGDTLVMLAAYHGHADTVEALCARGADPDRPNDRGQTPLAGAVFKGEDAVVETLVDHGADPRAGTPSAIDTARMFQKENYLRLFEGGPPDGPSGTASGTG